MNDDNLQRLPIVQTPAEEPDALETVVDEIALDARQQPEQYARDTRVPEGGE